MDKLIDKRGYRIHFLHQIIVTKYTIKYIKIKTKLQTVLSLSSVRKKMNKNDFVHEAAKVMPLIYQICFSYLLRPENPVV